MPELDAGYLLAPSAITHVYSVMFFPHDTEARRAFMHGIWAAAIMGATSPEPTAEPRFDHRMLEFVYTAPKPEDFTAGPEWKINRLASRISGWLLGFALRAAAHGRPDIASPTSIIRAVAGRVPRSLGSLEKDWGRYRPVAHLWLMHDSYLPPCGIHDRPSLYRFLAGAEYLRQKGEAWVPRRARKPILDPAATWKVPAEVELPSMCMILPPPTADEMQMFPSD